MITSNKKIINIILALLMITALILLPGCAKEEEPVPEEELLPIVNDISFTTYNQFALELLKSTRKDEENLILSPISVGITLTMLRMGAEGDTAKGIDEVLGMTIDDYNMVITQCAQIVDRLKALSGVRYDTGIGLYLDEGPSVRESYAVMAEDNFDMDIEFMNFDDPKAEIDINDWADIATSGRVEKLVRTDGMPQDILTLLININALDCVWEMGFDPTNTRPLPFNMDDGKGVSVPMMRGKLTMNFYEDENVTAGFLPMSGRETTLAILMPPEDVTLDEFINNMQAENIELWRYISVEAENYINIPKIDRKNIISFKTILSEMGAGDMFDPKKADFSNLGNEFYLGDMWQTTVFRALETGTAESNITAIDLTRAKGNEEYFFSVDRPFLFAAIDNQTGGILMIGTMTNPLKEDEYLSDDE